MEIKYFKNLGMQPQQLYIIEQAIKNNVSNDFLKKYFTDTRFNALQMEILLNAYLNELDYERIADFNIPEAQMEALYISMLKDKEEILKDQEKKEIVKHSIKASKVFYNSFILLAVILIFIILYIVVYPIYKAQNEPLEIILNADIVKINYKDNFNIKDNIKSYSNKDKYEIIYPEVNLNKLGKQNIELVLTNGFKTIRKSFILEIVDKISPNLELSNDKKEIYEKEINDFNCKDYINSVNDNFDDLKINNVKCSYNNLKLGENKIIYSISDSSNNFVEKTLILNIIENPKPKPTNSNNENSNSFSSATNNNESNISPSTQQNNTNSQNNPITPFIKGIGDISVAIDSDLNDLIFRLTSNITASGSVSVDYSAVNLSAAGSYPVFYYGSDGAKAQVTVYVN